MSELDDYIDPLVEPSSGDEPMEVTREGCGESPRSPSQLYRKIDESERKENDLMATRMVYRPEWGLDSYRLQNSIYLRPVPTPARKASGLCSKHQHPDENPDFGCKICFPTPAGLDEIIEKATREIERNSSDLDYAAVKTEVRRACEAAIAPYIDNVELERINTDLSEQIESLRRELGEALGNAEIHREAAADLRRRCNMGLCEGFALASTKVDELKRQLDEASKLLSVEKDCHEITTARHRQQVRNNEEIAILLQQAERQLDEANKAKKELHKILGRKRTEIKELKSTICTMTKK
jgi:hypothetical protein